VAAADAGSGGRRCAIPGGRCPGTPTSVGLWGMRTSVRRSRRPEVVVQGLAVAVRAARRKRRGIESRFLRRDAQRIGIGVVDGLGQKGLQARARAELSGDLDALLDDGPAPARRPVRRLVLPLEEMSDQDDVMASSLLGRRLHPQRPADVLAHQRARMVGALAQCRAHGLRRWCIAQGDGDVPQPTLVADAADRGALGAGQERGLIPGEQCEQGLGVETVAGQEVGLFGPAGEAVPRARQSSARSARSPS